MALEGRLELGFFVASGAEGKLATAAFDSIRIGAPQMRIQELATWACRSQATMSSWPTSSAKSTSSISTRASSSRFLPWVPRSTAKSAWEDAAMGLRDFQRRNGEYLIFTENSGWGGKDNFFRWRP